MKIYISVFISFLFIQLGSAQYKFKNIKNVSCTEVKSQDKTGTCWSYATSSFFESELLRMNEGIHDLSEMYVVREVYKDKARNYILRKGKANFSQGSLSHDLLRVMKEKGAMPQSAFDGLDSPSLKHNHAEMEDVLKGMLDGVLAQKQISKKWPLAFEKVLDVYLGECPKSFKYNGQETNPKDFSENLKINTDDYVNITSFTHHPFYGQFVLEIPDNYSNGSFYNLPLDEMLSIAKYAVNNGYSIAWDGDVSEKGFSAKEGIAVLASDPKREDLYKSPGKELAVIQELRQEGFESYATTDDHLMHAVGLAKDQTGTNYFVIKNSWGEISDFNGYLYMSEAFFKMKTVSILVHKDAIPADISAKMQL